MNNGKSDELLITGKMPQISSNTDFIDIDGGGQILKLSQNVFVYDIDIHSNEMELDVIKNINELFVDHNNVSPTIKTIQKNQAEIEQPFGVGSSSSNSNIKTKDIFKHDEIAESGNEQQQENTTAEYSCHRCKAVYDSRAKFEEHYK